jgi:hypothetical protein
MIAAYNNLIATGQAGVQAQMTTTISSIGLFQIVLNSFINNWSSLFTVNTRLFRIVACLSK